MKTSVKISLFSLFAALMINQTAQASLLVEPYLGYVSGKTELGSSNANYTGTSYGARVGFSNLGFALGLDYNAGKYTDDSNPKSDIAVGDLGVFVAFKFPVLVRAYLTYVPSPEVKVSNSVADFTFSDGNVTKLGVGFTGFPFVNINLEYIMGTYGKAAAGGSSIDIDPKFKTTAYALSVSAPFNFF